MSVPSDTVRSFLDLHWRPEGYTVPNATTYPFAWLWDSCFHSIVWAALDRPDRAVAELAHVFRAQSPSGFVPHVDYAAQPDVLTRFWGRSGSSSITQPPMYGHAVAELTRRGIGVPDAVTESATKGLSFLLGTRARIAELVSVVHPWETGCDDSPRWDHWEAGDWYRVKGELVESIERSDDGSPIANPAFPVAPASFNALVAWNALELVSVTGDDRLRASASELVGALSERYDDDVSTWVDAGPPDAERGSLRIRTLDALLPTLVVPHVALEQVTAGDGFGGEYGPTGVHRAEPAFDRRGYWRGPVWPQLAYLMWRAGADVAAATVRGAVSSGFAEYWDPDDGTGLGAIPQSWTALAVLMTEA